MSKEITLPRLGETMEKGTISKWLVKEKESFERGQTIAEIESDKTIVELPALESGKLVKILVNDGEEIEVGGVIATFETS